MSPVRSKEHLAFIRSLPCIVCGRDRNVEAAHAPGSRGMAQKRSDLETVPMCRIHHAEQHRIGWKQFLASYELDIAAWLSELSQKPRLVIRPLVRGGIATGLPSLKPEGPRQFYCAEYHNQLLVLQPVEHGIKASIQLAKIRCREVLIEEAFRKDTAA